MPYGYYYILKFAIVITAVIELMAILDKTPKTKLNTNNDIVYFVALAILYNPIVAIPLGKFIWSFVNIGTILFYVLYSKKLKWLN